MDDSSHIYRTILIGVIGIALGVFANNLMRKHENRRILRLLTDEKSSLESKAGNGELTPIEAKLLDRLQTEIYLVKFRCDA